MIHTKKPMPTGLYQDTWWFGTNPSLVVQRASDRQWGRNGRVVRLGLNNRREGDMRMLSIIVYSWAFRIGWVVKEGE